MDRYLIHELVSSPNAKILHFRPGFDSRDEFGNRAFSSPLSYTDREGRRVKAAMLVSPQGEKFIRENKGILQDLDKGMREFSEGINKGEFSLLKEEDPKIDLSHSRYLTWIASGGQSRTFILETEVNKYIVKTNVTMSSKYIDFTQPYINEMLQTQKLRKLLKKDLEEAHMDFGRFLFATGYMSCMEYVEGESGEFDMDDTKPVTVIYKKVKEMVRQFQVKRDPLWVNVDVDWTGEDHLLPTANMVKTKDKLVWIDPFMHKDMDNY